MANRVGPLAGVVAHSAGAAATSHAIRRGLAAERLVYISPPSELATFPRMFGDALGFTPEVQRRIQSRIEHRFDTTWEEIHGLDVARQMRIPLLVIHDEGDTEVPLASGRDLAAAWPGAELVATRGLGHRRILRDPAVAAHAVDFLGAPRTRRLGLRRPPPRRVGLRPRREVWLPGNRRRQTPRVGLPNPLAADRPGLGAPGRPGAAPREPAPP